MVHKKPNCRINAATVTIEEAGRILGLSKNAAYSAAHAGLIPGLVKVSASQFRVSKYALAQALGAPTFDAAVNAEIECIV